jgi:hypothetical protein
VAKGRRFLFTLILVLVLLAGGAIIGLSLANVTFEDILVKSGIMSVERYRSAELVSRDVRALAELNTVRYTMQRVFPYDFMDEGLSYTGVLAKLASSTEPAEDVLSPTEYRYWRTYNIALEAGLDPRPQAAEFVVVATTLYVGYELTSIADGGELVTLQENAGRAEVHLPRPRILNVVVQDVKPDEYPYPDVSLSPEAWRRIAQFVAEELAQESRPAATEQALFERAVNNTEALIRAVLTEAGFELVRFVTPEGAEGFTNDS